MWGYMDPICVKILPKSFQESIPNGPKSFQIVANMIQNRSLEGVWGCFVARLRPKAPVGRSLDASWAALDALGRLLNSFWALLGISWAPLGPLRHLLADSARVLVVPEGVQGRFWKAPGLFFKGLYCYLGAFYSFCMVQDLAFQASCL